MKAKLKNQSLLGLGILLATAALATTELSVSELWVKSLSAETDGDYVSALEIHKEIMPGCGKSYLPNLRAGWLLYLNEDYSNALKYYEKAASQSSGALAPLYGALNCQVALAESGKVVKVAKAILVLDENNYTANAQLAALHYQERKFSLAASFYRKLYRLYPEDLAVASGLAWSYLEQGEARQAAPLFNNILMVSPDYAYAERGREICNRMTNR